jgi:hypothetical protein
MSISKIAKRRLLATISLDMTITGSQYGHFRDFPICESDSSSAMGTLKIFSTIVSLLRWLALKYS